MRNSILIALVLSIILAAGVYAAAPNTTAPNNAGPFGNIEHILQDMDNKMQFIPGPQGPIGPAGVIGPQGPQGNVSVNVISAINAVTPKYQVFLQLNGIPGESIDANHQNWIEIFSYSFGSVMPIDPASGQASGKSSVSSLTISKLMDISSPKIFLDSVQGTLIKNATIDVVSNGNVVVEYKFDNLMVSSYQITGSSHSGDEVPTEAVTLNFQKLEETFNQIDNGNIINSATVSWDKSILQS